MTIEQELMRNLHRASAATRRHSYKSSEEPHHRNRGFTHILDLLNEGEGKSQQQLADTLHIRPQSVSEALAILESRGYIDRKPSTQDKRITLVYITPQGLERRAALAQERKEHAMTFFSVLTEEEKQSLLSLLHKINHTVQEAKEEV